MASDTKHVRRRILAYIAAGAIVLLSTLWCVARERRESDALASYQPPPVTSQVRSSDQPAQPTGNTSEVSFQTNPADKPVSASVHLTIPELERGLRDLALADIEKSEETMSCRIRTVHIRIPTKGSEAEKSGCDYVGIVSLSPATAVLTYYHHPGGGAEGWKSANPLP